MIRRSLVPLSLALAFASPALAAETGESFDEMKELEGGKEMTEEDLDQDLKDRRVTPADQPKDRPRAGRSGERQKQPERLDPKERDERLMRYARNRARLVDGNVGYQQRPRRGRDPYGGNYGAWFISVGGERLSHWQFAQELSYLTNDPIGLEMQEAYEPANQRSTGIMVSGLILSGITTLLGVSLLLLQVDDCRGADGSVWEGVCNTDNDDGWIVGGVVSGVGVLGIAASGTYAALTTTPLPKKTEWYARDEANHLVRRYNKYLRREIGVPDTADRELRRRREEKLRERRRRRDRYDDDGYYDDDRDRRRRRNRDDDRYRDRDRDRERRGDDTSVQWQVGVGPSGIALGFSF